MEMYCGARLLALQVWKNFIGLSQPKIAHLWFVGRSENCPTFPMNSKFLRLTIPEMYYGKRYTITGSEVAHCIRSVPGGFLLICETDNGTDYDFAVIRLDLNGDVLWNHTYGTNEFDIPIHAERTSDGVI